jgi:hypothetical protein
MFSSAPITGVGDFSRIPGTVKESVSYYQKIESDSTAWGRGVAEVSVSAPRLVAWVWRVDTNERVIHHVKTDGASVFRKWIFIPKSHSMLYAFVMPLGGGLSDRVFASWIVWRLNADQNFEIAIAPLHECPMKSSVNQMNRLISQDPRADKAILGSLRGMWTVTPLAHNVCRVVTVSQGSMNGSIPNALLNLRIKSSLGIIATIQRKYERNGNEVDGELREAFPLPPTTDELNPEQRDIFDQCRALELTDGSNSNFNSDSDSDSELLSWIDIPSPSVFVKMSMKHVVQKNDKRRSVALGRAKTVIDVHPKVALAYLFTYCSHDRMRIDSEEGNLARVIDSQASPHDNVVATIKVMPLLLRSREFVVRQLAVRENEDFIHVIQSVPTNVDYGFRAKTVRGTTTAIARFTPITINQTSCCKVTLHQYVDANGHIPIKVLNHKLPLALSGVEEMRSKFQRNDEMDKRDREELSRVLFDKEQIYTEEENELFERVIGKLTAGTKEDDVREIKSADHLVEMAWSKVQGGVGIGKASTTVDASSEDCAVWEMSKMSRENTKLHGNFGGLEKSLTRRNAHSSLYHVVYKGGFAIMPREWVQYQLWRRTDQVLELVYESTEHADIPPNSDYVRAKSTVLYRFEKLPDVSGNAQTRVTLTQRIDLGGALPKKIVDSVTVSSLSYLSTMRLRFDRSSEIDGAAREIIVQRIGNCSDAYSEQENEIVDEGAQTFSLFDDQKAKTIEMESRLTTAKIAFKKGDSQAWGYSSTIVLTTPEDILAYSWCTLSRDKRRDDDLEKAIEEERNGHNQLIYNKKRTAEVLNDRDFLGRTIWKKIETGFIFVTKPDESEARPPQPGVVRAAFPSVMKISKLNDKETKVQYVIHPDFGGGVPSFMMNWYTAKNLNKVTEIREFFQALRGLEQFGENDGKAIGDAMVVKTKAEKHHREEGETRVEARVRNLFKNYKGLREMKAKHEFFEPMMARLVRNKLWPAGDVNSKLCSVTPREGTTIGAGLSLALVGNLTSEAAVDEWILRYPALGELDREEVWFRPMMNTIAMRLLSEVAWGLKFRLISASLLSVLDIVSDINVVVQYMRVPELMGFGRILIFMIGTSLFLQLLVAIFKNKKDKAKMAKECLIVVTGLKVPYDSYHVISGSEGDNDKVDTKLELTWSKTIEMFAEAIPGTVLQVYAALRQVQNGQVVSTQALGSIAISMMTTGFTSAVIAYDNDTDPSRRKESPGFYGFIPDKGSTRTLTLLCMTMNCTLLLAIRSLSASLLMLMKPSYFASYWAGSFLLFLLQKTARGDFRHHMAAYGVGGFLLAISTRLIVLAVADFTGTVEFRHPYQLGGIYWTFNILFGIATSFAIAKLYYLTVSVEKVALSEKFTWNLLGSLGVAWIAIFAFFLLIIKKEYRNTFFSTKLGWESTIELFYSYDDATRISIFKKNKWQWESIREEVMEWVMLNWWDWQDDTPPWLTDLIIANIPDDLIPADESREALADLRRRKSSIMPLANLRDETLPMKDKAKEKAKTKAKATVVPVEGADETDQ